MSISLVVTAGFGTGVLTGSIADVVTRGYSIGEAVVIGGAIIKITPAIVGRLVLLDVPNRLMTPCLHSRYHALRR